MTIRVSEAFSYKGEGFAVGQEVDADHPAARAAASNFEPPVERATARPGEKRATRRAKSDEADEG